MTRDSFDPENRPRSQENFRLMTALQVLQILVCCKEESGATCPIRERNPWDPVVWVNPAQPPSVSRCAPRSRSPVSLIVLTRSCSRRWGPCPSPTPCLVCPFYLFYLWPAAYTVSSVSYANTTSSCTPTYGPRRGPPGVPRLPRRVRRPHLPVPARPPHLLGMRPQPGQPHLPDLPGRAPFGGWLQRGHAHSWGHY